MSVFIVFYSIPYEGDEIMGIFSTREKAQEYVDGQKSKKHIEIIEHFIDKPIW